MIVQKDNASLLKFFTPTVFVHFFCKFLGAFNIFTFLMFNMKNGFKIDYP